MLRRFLHHVFRTTEELNRRSILRLVEERPGGSMLDCGCCDGGFTLRLAERSKVDRVHGVELIGERARAAQAGGVRVTRADLNAPLPFAEGSFDLVHSNQVIEHLHDTDAFLRSLRRVLRPGGQLLLSTNNLASWHNVLSLALGFQPPPMHPSSEVILGNPFDPLRGQRHPEGELTHLRLFSYVGLRELLEYHGFRVRRLISSGYYPLPGTAARVMARIDRRHGAFLVADLTV